MMTTMTSSLLAVVSQLPSHEKSYFCYCSNMKTVRLLNICSSSLLHNVLVVPPKKPVAPSKDPVVRTIIIMFIHIYTKLPNVCCGLVRGGV